LANQFLSGTLSHARPLMSLQTVLIENRWH
jgi:hypothetical protein